MVAKNYTSESSDGQITCSFSEYESVFNNLEDTGLLQRLEAYHLVGRRGHPVRAYWRAYVISYLRNYATTNDLIRALQDDPSLRLYCGFRTLPHRRSFNKFFHRLADHANLVEQVLAGLTNQLKALLPDLGKETAVDSTVVGSHSRPYRKDKQANITKESSDPEAGWTAKNSPRAKKDGKEWFWGFKMHQVTDVNHDLPIGQFVTTASRSDNPQLPSLIEKAQELHPWFKPQVVIGGQGV